MSYAPPGFNAGHTGHHQQPTPIAPMNQSAPVQMIVIGPQVGPDPVHVTCPNCRESVSTLIDKKANMKAHVACGVLTAFGCWLCCCIPYFLESFKKVEHKCPRCQAMVGIYNK